MTRSPDVWLFVLSTLLTSGLGLILTAVAYKSYKRERADFLLFTTLGFAFLTLGTITEALYEFSLNSGFPAFGRELYFLRTVESFIIALGFLLLIYSLRSV